MMVVQFKSTSLMFIILFSAFLSQLLVTLMFINSFFFFFFPTFFINGSGILTLYLSWQFGYADSSSNVCIEDSYISTGDDLVAVKSGWDEYGIAYGRPSSDITIRRVTGSSPFSGIAVGSEASGGIENVLAEHINLYNMGVGIHIKTNTGRGGFIKNVTASNVYVENARKGIKISGDVGDHPDDKFNPNALPVVSGITIKDVWGVNVQQAGLIQGIKGSPFTDICLSNINLRGITGPRTPRWQCSDVRGAAYQVSPWPCSELSSVQQRGSCSSFS